MSTSVLSRMDRLTQKLGPLSSIIDSIIRHIAPQQTASACSGTVCYYSCQGTQIVYYYSVSAHWCAQGVITCSQGFYDPNCE